MTIYEHLEHLISATQHLRVIEIGAAEGNDTRRLFELCTRKCEHLDFWCFEPDPRNFAALRKNIAALPVRTFDLAMGATDCETELFMSSGPAPWSGREHTLSSSIKRPQEHLRHFPWCTFPKSVRVKQVSLDSFVAPAMTRVDFIWCDAQGAEGEIIAGGRNLLRKTRLFYFESSAADFLYEGQLTRSEMLGNLPEWKVIEEYTEDVLVENLCFRGEDRSGTNERE